MTGKILTITPRIAGLPKVPDAPISQDVPGFTRPFTMNDPLCSIKAMKNNKAAGLDDILCEQIKQLRPDALNWLLKMLNECFGTNNIPKLWRKFKVIALLKPDKDAASPKSYRPISLLCHKYKMFERLILNGIAPFVDEHLIPEQAGFRPGKSCTGQLLNLTQFIEDGYESKLITGTAFVDLSAAYDTVNHRILTRKIFELTRDVRLTGLIQTLLSNRRYFVVLSGNRSRWHRQKNGLPQGSVLAPLLFNVYMNDQPIHPNTRSFLYADDLCIATQNQSFVKLEESLSDPLAILISYYGTNYLRANPDKTQISAFHLKNRDANHQLRISWYGKRLKYTPNPVYLGVTLDRPLTYKNHIANTKAKVGARNSIFKKQANTNWGTDARTIRTTALALCFSAAEYASPVWSRCMEYLYHFQAMLTYFLFLLLVHHSAVLYKPISLILAHTDQASCKMLDGNFFLLGKAHAVLLPPFLNTHLPIFCDILLHILFLSLIFSVHYLVHQGTGFHLTFLLFGTVSFIHSFKYFMKLSYILCISLAISMRSFLIISSNIFFKFICLKEIKSSALLIEASLYSELFPSKVV